MFNALLNFITETFLGGFIMIVLGFYILISSLRDAKSEEYIPGNVKGVLGGLGSIISGLIIIVVKLIDFYKWLVK
jgi:uncharacterized membrane protein YjjP (DUF1212 family)